MTFSIAHEPARFRLMIPTLLAGFGVLLLGGCTTVEKGPPMSDAQLKAIERTNTAAIDKLMKGEKLQSPPYPATVPAEGAACKSLVVVKRHMMLSEYTAGFIVKGNLRPWAIYRYDVDAKGVVSNVRPLQSSGPEAVDFEFKASVESWTFAPGKGAKDCIAEMKIT